MRTQIYYSILCFLIVATGTEPVQAQLKLATIFSDHMVLQRDRMIPVWGTAKARAKVQVRFQDQQIKTKADANGKWKVELGAVPAGGPYTLEVQSKREKIELKDVLTGDVWICSGQSNMEWPMTLVNDSEKEIKAADYPNIRLFDVQRNIQFVPAEDIFQPMQWNPCSPEHVRNFSGVGYFFGRMLHQELNVPIGLISTNWGGTEVETWMSAGAIEAIDGFEGVCDPLNADTQLKMEESLARKKAKYQAMVQGIQPGLIDDNAYWAASDLDESQWQEMEIPQLWENAGLDGLDGVLWFRKEVEIPKWVASRGATLHLGPIDDSDICWINGKEVGRTHQRYDALRTYVIEPGVLKEGKNVIAVRVEDTGGGGGLWGQTDAYFLEQGAFKAPLSGKWKYRISPTDLKVSGSIGPNSQPTLLYNGMIAPLVPYSIKGAIWYQGESNAGRAYEYRELFPAMIQDWRRAWGYDFPFFFVQLANFKAAKEAAGDSDWAELREAQTMTLSLPQTGQALCIDIGEADDIHPRNKQEVGRRLALSALKVAYHQKVVHSGPIYKSMKVEGSAIRLAFSQIGGGLVAKDKYGYLKGFAIAGEDKVWYWAQATIQGDAVLVSSPAVPNPVAVRYAWADNPDDANFYNAAGLPAVPFRTDAWPGITQGKHRKYPPIR